MNNSVSRSETQRRIDSIRACSQIQWYKKDSPVADCVNNCQQSKPIVKVHCSWFYRMLPLKVTFLTRLAFYQLLTWNVHCSNRNLFLFLSMKSPKTQPSYHKKCVTTSDTSQKSHLREFFACYCNLPTSQRKDNSTPQQNRTSHRWFFALTSKPMQSGWTFCAALLFFLRLMATWSSNLFWITTRQA